MVRAGHQLVLVGRTNRRALLAGAGGARSAHGGDAPAAGAGDTPVVTVPTREAAVAWVRANLGEGDAVLYENDLPDHFP